MLTILFIFMFTTKHTSLFSFQKLSWIHQCSFRNTKLKFGNDGFKYVFHNNRDCLAYVHKEKNERREVRHDLVRY